MRRNIFIRTLLILSIIIGDFNIFAQETRTFDFNHKGGGIELLNQTRGNVTIEYSIDHLELTPLVYKGEEMQSVVISGIGIPNEKGLPNVPVFSRFVAVPQGAEAVLKIVNYEQTLIEDVNIEPSLGIQAEDQEPDMNYVKDQRIYSENAFYPAEFASLGEPVSMRGVDMVAVDIAPVQYNPVTKQAVVYHNIKLEIEFRGGNGHIGDDRLRSPYWDPILEQNLLNYESLPEIDYEARMQQWLRDGSDGCEYIIVTPNNDGWTTAARNLKEYRTRQGIITEVYRLDEMGVTTTDQMKTWFHNAYKNWTIKPVAVLMFGDHNDDMTQGVPAELVSHPYQPCVSDNQYADVTGDCLPDIVFSRLVAANGAEASMMASKQIEYEYTNPNMDAASYQKPVTALGWQTERWFQLCSEVVGGYFRSKGKTPVRVNKIYAGTPGNVWSTANNTNQVVSYFGPNGTNYIPAKPSELGDWDNGTASQIMRLIEDGTMLVQHRDHGYEQGWGEPGFSVAHVNQLNNVGKMPFVMSINCLTGKYNHNTNCFAEALMRRTSNGHNAGAVGVLCPTQVSFSFCNDALVWGVYDHFQPDFMPNYGPYANRSGNWLPAFGNVAGKYFLAQSSWPLNPGSKQITYQMFTAHCDAFLRLFSEVPRDISLEVQHQPKMFTGADSFQVLAPAGTTIALSIGEGDNTQLIAVATATGSQQDIAISTTLQPTTILKVTVTGQNCLRYVANVEVIAQNGPYVLFNDHTINNENHQLEYGENNVDMSVIVKNVGVDLSGEVTATISTESEYVTISQNMGTTTEINPNATKEIDGFKLNVADNVPDSTIIRFTLVCTSGGDTWTSYFLVTAHAPQLEVASLTMEDDIMPGCSGNISFELVNKGSATAKNAVLTLSKTSTKITLPTTVFEIGEIEANSTTRQFVELQSDNDIELGTQFDISHNLTAMEYSTSGTLKAVIGIYSETFEGGNLYKYQWSQGDYPWAVVSDKHYRGSYSAKSTNHTGDSSGDLSITVNVIKAGEISFYHCESTELGCDELKFYIDNKVMGSWSGTTVWTQFKANVSVGSHVFRWSYVKDPSFEGGWDCAWIDDIKFPPANIEPPFPPVANLQADIVGYSVTLTWIGDANATGYAVMRDGVIVATLPKTTTSFSESFSEPGTYNYTVTETDGVLTSPPADLEVTIEPFKMHWTPNVNQYQCNMCVTSIIKIDDVEQRQPTLEIGTFCNDECCGSQTPQFFENGKEGRYILNLMVYGDSGSKDEITFRIYDHVNDEELDYTCSTKINFEPNTLIGNPTAPFNIEFTTGTPISGTLASHVYTEKCVIVGPTTIPNGVTVEFQKTLNGTTIENLTVEDGGQLIVGNSIYATVKKNIEAANWTPNNADNWYGIGILVANNAPTSIEGLVTQGDNNDYDLFRYDEQEHFWINYKVDETFNTLEAGRGYLYASQAGTTLKFKGKMNFEDVTASLTSTENIDLKGFNFIANPYTHDIFKGEGTAIENEALASGFYKMKRDGAWQTCLNNKDAIHSGEAILVNTSENCTIDIVNTTSKGSAKSDHDFIGIIVSGSKFEDEAFALFDKGRPLAKISHKNPDIQSVYIIEDAERYAVATMDANSTSFNFGVDVATTSMMSIRFETQGVFEYLHLIDRSTGDEIDMLLEDCHSFIATPNDIESRFIVELKYKSCAEADEIIAYQAGDELIVNGEGTLQVIDILGRIVVERQISGSERMSVGTFTTGTFVLRIIGNESKTQKIVIR